MLSKKQQIVTVSTIISVAIVLIGIVVGDSGVLGNLVIIAAFISIVPFFIYKYSELMWLKSLESWFPNFIRDVADSKRSGMSLPESIRLAAKSNYGKLTPEIVEMSNRLSWGTPFLRVIDIFAKKVKKSKIINEALNIIKESHTSGGDIAKTLDSVVSDMVMIKEAEAEKSSLVKEHVMLMYGIFYMFMAVSIMIIFVMVPMIESSQSMGSGGSGMSFGGGAGGMGAFSDPCDNTGYIFPCGLFSSICMLLDHPPGISCYYLAMFLSVIIIQGLLMGLIAGQLGEGSVTAGSKHALIMVFSAIGLFLFLAKLGIFPS